MRTTARPVIIGGIDVMIIYSITANMVHGTACIQLLLDEARYYAQDTRACIYGKIIYGFLNIIIKYWHCVDQVVDGMITSYRYFVVV